MSLWRKPASFILPIAIAGLITTLAILQAGLTVPAVKGVVLDEAGPVANAVVRLRAESGFVLTDESGGFALPVAVAPQDAQLTAWAPGYFISGSSESSLASPVALALRKHPALDNSAYQFISPLLDMSNPAACSHCHRDQSGAMNGAMPVEEWRQDAHASAAVNPRFLSLYNGTTIDGLPGQPTTFRFNPVVGTNVPSAPSLGLDLSGPGFRLDFPDQTGSCATCHVPVAALQSPYNADPNLAEGVAAEGVTCDFCHKIQGVRLRQNGLPDPGLPGVLSIEFLRPHEGEQVFIGPFDDTPGDDIYSPLQNQSAFCAPCHTGQFWDVSIYNSFGEWLDSPYSNSESGKTCQDCHMPHVGATMFAQLPPDNAQVLPPRDPETIFSHCMPGAADPDLLETTATLGIATNRSSEQLQVTVQVTNSGAGHHIPTDSPLRNMILLVRAMDSDGQPLTLLNGPTIPRWSGEGDPAEGYYAGLPGVLYAKVLADFFTGETPTYAYWRQTRLVSDNRLPALATDETVYEFALPPDAGTIVVNAQLYLRRAFIELMDLKGWTTPDMLMAQRMVSVP